jgi:GTPase SAR1 family protein
VSRYPWDWAYVYWFKGESVALLGQRGTGKTTLYNYLTDRKMDGPPEPTLAPEPRGWNKNDKVGLNLKGGYDVPGGEANYRDWQDVFASASKVFYLFDAHKLRLSLDGHQQRISDDGKALRDWAKGAHAKRIMLLGTHADTDPRCREVPIHQYQDEIMDLEVTQAFVGRTGASGHAVGTMTTKTQAESLVRRAMGKQ